MSKTDNLSFSNLRIQPFLSVEEMLNNYPAIDSIRTNRYFLYNDSYVDIALVFKVQRQTELSPYEAFHQNFIAEITEQCCDEPIASEYFTINMDSWLESQECRVDISLDGSMLKPDVGYHVNIRRRRDHEIQIKLLFCLYSTQSIETLYNQRVSDVGLGTLSLFTSDDLYISLNRTMLEDGGLIFTVERDNSILLPEIPNYSIMFVGSDNWHTTVDCVPKYFLEEYEPTMTYQCKLPEDIYTHGVVAAIIFLLNRSVAAAVFDFSNDESILGSVPDNEIISLQNCNLTRLQTFQKVRDIITDSKVSSNTKTDINALVGIKDVKDKIESFMNIARLNMLRKKAGLHPLDMPLHAMFLGSPGTGKTTVAKLIGERLKEMGILSIGHVVVKDRSSLVGKYYGSEEEAVTKALEESKGGVLFIDEAYQLVTEDDTRDPGKNVINSLMAALADPSNRDWMLILAGYTEPTLKLFEINPGLESRIPETNRYYFADFTADELCQIATTYLDSRRLILTPDALDALKDVLRKDYDSRTESFGNARHVVNLIETSILPALARRISGITTPTLDQLTTIVREDIPTRNNYKEEADAKYLLDHMIGLGNVKKKIDSYLTITQFNTARNALGLSTFDLPLHSMFLGSPGTGKTTVAKLMGKLLRRAGVLSKGHVVVRERSNFIGRYYGDEEKNVTKALREARGGILFIDEAYQLVKNGDPKDPGRNVIEALMTAMADTSNRDWMLILAGYTGEMKRIFEINPGLKSRIPETNIYRFDDYNVEELMAIASGYFSTHNLTLEASATEALAIRLQHDYNNKGTDFGNGRHVVNLIETDILPKMAARLASSDKLLMEADLSTVRSCDIPIPTGCSQKRVRLGFAV